MTTSYNNFINASSSTAVSSGDVGAVNMFTNVYLYQAAITTTTNTATTIFSFVTSNNAVYSVTSEVAAYCTATTGSSTSVVGDSAIFRQLRRETNVAGTLTVAATATESLSGNGFGTGNTVATAISSSGTNLIVTVTGTTNCTIDWIAYIQIVTSS